MSQVNDLTLNLVYSAPEPKQQQLRTNPPKQQQQHQPRPLQSAAAQELRNSSVHPARQQQQAHNKRQFQPRGDNAQHRAAAAPHQTQDENDERESTAAASDRPAPVKYQAPKPVTVLPQLPERHITELSNEQMAPLQTGLISTSAFAQQENFNSFQLEPRLLAALQNKLHLSRPTHVQSLALPVLMNSHNAKRDFCIKASTGSGKTLSFLIPILHSLVAPHERLTRQSGVRLVILLPTRELCIQINNVLSTLLLSYHWIVATCLMGGEAMQSEKARLRRGVNVVIASPGRLLDHLQHTECLRRQMHSVQWLALDEADRLMSMGFEEDLKSILKEMKDSQFESRRELKFTQVPVRRQTVLISATLDRGLTSLMESTMHDPIFIGFNPTASNRVNSEEDDTLIDLASSSSNNNNSLLSLPPTLAQHYVTVESRHRLVALAALLRQQILLSHRRNATTAATTSSNSAATPPPACKILVFVSTCACVEFLTQLYSHACTLTDDDDSTQDVAAVRTALLTVPLLKLHGSLPQATRTATYQRFMRSSSAVLFATDVACRGLDFEQVSLVVQYDPPESIAAYAHRSGRTARMGRQGAAILFLTANEAPYLEMLSAEKMQLKELALPRILSALRITDEGKVLELRSRLPGGALLQRQFEALVSGRPELRSLACDAYASAVRAYAAYPRAVKHIFHPRSLHLGHVCRAFALLEPPSKAAKQTSDALLLNERRKKRKAEDRAIAEEIEQKAKDEAADSKQAVERTELNKRKRSAQMTKKQRTDDQFNAKTRSAGQSDAKARLTSIQQAQLFARHKPDLASEFAA